MLESNKTFESMSYKIKSNYSIITTLLIAIFFLTPFPLYSTTISFQDGVSPSAGYSGTFDTYLDDDEPDDNYGSSTEILIDGSPDDYGTLLKWDISAIPSGESIQSASITLTAFNSTSDEYEVYEMKRDWVESQATWNEYTSGNNWQTSGAQGINDRGTTVLGTITGGAGAHTITLNSSGIALVQSWVDNPSTNFGIIIQDYSGATDGMDLYSSEYATTTWRPTFTVQYGASGVIESRVSTGNDDAEEQNPPNGNMYRNSSDLELIRDGSTDQEVGMRFNNITLSQGITITNAYIQFTVDETGSETTNLIFYGDDTDNAPTFSSSSGDITNRTKTSVSVNWNNVPAWNSTGATGSDQRTPDLSSIIQEIVDRSGWSSGNSIVIIVDGSGKRTAESYNGSPGSAPLLHIQYGTGSAGQTYYVRTDGNDSNSGTSNSSSGAWLTIQKAASTMTAGDSVRVQPGTYYDNVTPANSGTAGNSIVYKADGTVVMDGQNNSGYAFYMDGKDYIVIDGFTITNWPDGGGSHGTVKFRNSDHGVVRNCIIHDTGRDAIYFKGSSNNCLVENNLIYNIDDDGISPKGNGDHTIRNNTFYSCGGWAIEHTNTNGNVYENNIFWDNLDNTTGANVTFSYNNHIGGVLPGTGNISSDPLFVNSSGNDFHLSHTTSGQSSDSPCIDAGSATASSLGLDTRTTRTDQVVDAGQVDLGYHYRTGVVSFSDWTSIAGLGGCTNKYGIAWGDYNNDGYPDLYITERNALYKNNGDGTFSTEPPYLYCGNRAGHWADYDNDGDLDFGSTYNMYFSINNGDGTFTMQSNSTMGFTQINNLGDFGWLDYNEDGYLDLWAPNGSSPYTYMYSNDGDGTFTGIAGSTIGLTANFNGETTVVTDYDGDGHTDILYRANSLTLWHSDGDGTFTDVTSSAGVSLSGTSGGYNGTAFGDYDNDGDLDFYGGQTGANKLYRNNNDGTFTDVTSTAGVEGFSKKTKGVAWGDYDNDGNLDLYVAHENGANQLFHNNGDGTFTDVAPSLGLNDNSKSYGVGWADYDLDGDLDLFVGNKDHASKLFKNQLVDTDYLKVKVRGSGAGGAPLDGTGSRVELWNSAGTTLLAVREVNGGEGMGSHPPRIVHFGLASSWGGSSGTYMVKVKFTSGNQVVAQNVIPDQRSITIGSTTLNHTIEVFEGSLLAELRMDECFWDGTGDEVADSSGNANHSTSYGGATITTDGKVCNGGLFDGVDGYVEVPDLGIGTATISMWINPTQTSNNTRILSNIDEMLSPFGNQFALQFNNDKVQIWSNAWQDITSSTIPTNQWTHLAIVINGGQATGYINGIEELTQSDDYTLHKLGIGSIFKAVGGSWGNYFSGKIDEVRFYRVALTSIDIQNLMADSRTCRSCEPPDPIAWWQLDECEWEGTTNEVVDSSGNGYHGTAFGEVTTGEGEVCRGGIFDGGDDYIALDMFYNQTGQITQLTGAAWVKTSVSGTSWSGNWAIIDFDRSEYFNLFIRGDDGLVGFSTTSSNGTIHDHYGNTAVNDGQWHFVVGIYNGIDKIIYVDGVEDSRVVDAHGGLAIGTGQTRYGFIGDGSEASTFNGSRNQLYYDGAIDEVTIYDEALSQYHVQTLYSQTSRTCIDCTTDPVAAWYMDEVGWDGTTNEVVDSSGNSHHGVAVNGTNTTPNGKVNRAGSFDGIDDNVDAGNYSGLNFTGKTTATFAVWIKSSDNLGSILEQVGSGCTNYRLDINNGKARFLYEKSSCTWESVTGNTSINDNAWHHIAAVMDGNELKLYVDGSLDGTSNQTGAIFDDGILTIGKNFSGTDWYDGLIDEVYIFDHALTSYEVVTVMNKTHGHPPYDLTYNIENFPKNKWVLLGVPVQPSPADATSVVGDDFGSAPPYWRVVRWDTDLLGYAFYQENGEGPYALPGEEPPEFAPGLGFWVIQGLHDQVTIDVDGVEVDDNYQVDLVGPPTGVSVGKNMIANPYASRIDWSDVQVTDGSTTLSITDAGIQGWVNSHAYSWNWQNSMYEVVTPNTGSTGDSISVEEGFWVLQMDANKDLDLIFKKLSGQPKLLADNRMFVSRYGDEVRPMKRTELQGLTDWSGILYLHTTDGVYTALDNRFGVDPNGQEGFDGLDASWFAPMASEYGALYFIASDGSELVHDIRNPEWTEQNWHFKVLDSNVNGSWQLRWPNVASIPGSIQLSLESPQGTMIVSELRDNLSYDFSLTSGSDRDFYLNAQVVEDSISANLNIGFVQNPGISKYLNLYLFPDEPLDFMLVFVDGAPTPASNVDPLYNVYGGPLEMSEGGQKEIVVHTMDLALNQGTDTLQYNFVLSDGGAALVEAPDDLAELSIPGGFLPENSWIGIGVQSSRTAEALGPVYSIQPFGITFPEGSELILSGTGIEDLLGNANVYRKTSYGRELIQAIYEPVSRTIHVPIQQSGQYILLKSDDGISGILPLQTSLMDNYPNPFNATTVIPYKLQEQALVSIKLYDLLGREVVELVNKPQSAGYYRVTWDGRDGYGKPVSSGVYLIHYRAGSYTRTNKLMLLK